MIDCVLIIAILCADFEIIHLPARRQQYEIMASCARLTLFRSLPKLKSTSLKPVFVVRAASSSVKAAQDKVDESDNKTDLSISLQRPEDNQIATSHDAIDLSNASYNIERFIPVTRRALVRHIYQHPDLLSSEGKRSFDQLALLLEDAITKQSNRIMEELKVTSYNNEHGNSLISYLMLSCYACC